MIAKFQFPSKANQCNHESKSVVIVCFLVSTTFTIWLQWEKLKHEHSITIQWYDDIFWECFFMGLPGIHLSLVSQKFQDISRDPMLPQSDKMLCLYFAWSCTRVCTIATQWTLSSNYICSQGFSGVISQPCRIRPVRTWLKMGGWGVRVHQPSQQVDNKGFSQARAK